MAARRGLVASSCGGLFLMALAALAGCDSGAVVGFDPLVTECKSLEASSPDDFASDDPAPRDAADGEPICEETLDWTYARSDHVLRLTHANTLLNCCGLHDVQLTGSDAGLVMLEIDEPDYGARCGCVCRFDFSVSGVLESDGPVPLEIRQQIPDEFDGVETVWTGAIDLRDGSGRELIRTVSCW